MSEKLQGYARQIADTRPPASGIGIFWIGQAGFILRGQRTTLAIDAYLSPRDTRRFDAPVAAAELGFVDAFLATHQHRDHLDLPQWPAFAAAAPRARFVVPAPIVDRAAAAVGDGRVTGAAPDTVITIGDARITPIPACHGVDVADAYSFGLTAGEYRHLGYVVDLDGVRLFHSGDTIRYDGMAERLRALDVEVALLPINGRSPEREAQELVGNLSAHEAADLAADAGIPAMVPMHHDTIAGNTRQRRRPERVRGAPPSAAHRGRGGALHRPRVAARYDSRPP